MKLLLQRLLALWLLLLAACAPVRVHFDYEPLPDWSGYQAYAMYPSLHTGLSELDEGRLLDRLDEVLGERGFRQSEDPDFLIDITSEAYEAAPGSSVGLGMGGTGGRVGGGISVGIPVASNKIQRKITFNIIDAATQRLVWQAVATDTFRENATPLEREQRLLQVVLRVFSGFPPQK